MICLIAWGFGDRTWTPFFPRHLAVGSGGFVSSGYMHGLPCMRSSARSDTAGHPQLGGIQLRPWMPLLPGVLGRSVHPHGRGEERGRRGPPSMGFLKVRTQLGRVWDQCGGSRANTICRALGLLAYLLRTYLDPLNPPQTPS